MKIAQVAPLYEAVPPKLYGGTERVVAHLSDALVDLGHDVTLFSSAEAKTKARLIAVRDQAIRLDPAPLKSDLAAHLSMMNEVRKRQDEFDIIHFHVDMVHFPMFERVAARTLTTLHGRLDLKDLPEVYRAWPKYPLVSISDSQRQFLPFANWAGTVYHGMPEALYVFEPKPRGYLAFLGRISPEKGPERAIAIAKKVGMPLKMAAKVDAADRAYFDSEITPPARRSVDRVHRRDRRRRQVGLPRRRRGAAVPDRMAGALRPRDDRGDGLRHAGDRLQLWQRAGGDRRTASPAIVVEGEAEAVAAVAAARRLDRREIRRRFDRRFSATAMARGYLDLYADRLARQPYGADLASSATPLASVSSSGEKPGVAAQSA